MSDEDFKNKYVGLSEKPMDLAKSCLAEVIGNLYLNFFGCMSVVDRLDERFSMDVLRSAIVFGMVITVLVQSLNHVGGAHFNPAVTLGFLSAGKVTIIRSVLYIIAQCFGAVLGNGLLMIVTPKDYRGLYGITSVNTNLTDLQGVLVEVLLTFLLVFVNFAVADANNPIASVSGPFTIGLTVTVGAGTAIPYTGASINPARSFGSAVFAENWEDHWVLWIGPCSGSLLATLLYKYVFSTKSSEG